MGGTNSADLLHGHVVGSVGTSVYVAGFFYGTANFPTGVSKTSAGGADIFLMALDTTPPPAPALASISTRAGSLDSSSFDAALLSILADLDDSTSRKR